MVNSKFKIQHLTFFLLIFISSIVNAQTVAFKNGGINAGLSFNFGSTVNRLGIYIGGFYYHDFIQVNSSLRCFYNFKTFGPSISGFEFQPSLGVIATFGERREDLDHFFEIAANQTGRRFSLGYAYNFYFDQMNTTQRTGTITIGVDKFKLISENDLLAVPRSDRFRTGAVKITYQYLQSLFAINMITWTGNPQSKNTRKVRDSDYPSRFGYVDISESPYGKFSHGILAFQFKHALGYGQDAQLSLGLDSERVRNFFQNKLIHDMYFWPQKWNKAKNMHLPMLDAEGLPYLFKEGQKIKPSRFYYDLSLNPTIFY